MRKKLLIMALALAALLGLTTAYATAASGANTDTLYVGAGQPFNTLDAALNYAARTRSADPVEIVLQSDTTMNTTARSAPRDITIKSDEGGPYTVTNTADFVVDNGCNLTLENVAFTSRDGRAFQVNDGTLVTNDAVTISGNIVVSNGNTYTLNEGTTITGGIGIIHPANANARVGGGISVRRGGQLIMNGGEITGNNSSWGGGVWVEAGGTFTMNGGTISGNSAPAGGGGICDDGTFTMNGGTISGNSAPNGGGGGVMTGTTGGGGGFTMNGGTISDNSAPYGGGVYIPGGTSFTMKGGKITGNTATTAGGGIYFANNSTLYLSDTPVVRDNVLANGTPNNFYSLTTAVNVTAPLTDGADVWVTYPSNEGVVFGTASNAQIAAASAPYFRNDVNPLTGTANGGTNLKWAPIVAELVQDGTVHSRYASLSDALAVYTNQNTQMIQLAADITTPSTVDKTIYLDLNGKTITGALTVEDGCTLNGLDSATDGYTGTGYGKILNVTNGSNIAPYTDTEKAHTTKEKHYLTVKENNEISFHRYNVQVNDYYFRLEFDQNDSNDKGSAMMNFGAAVQGDSHVADAITKLELSSTPTGSGSVDKTTVSPLSDLTTALKAGNTYTHRSNFIFLSNPYTAEYALKATLSMTLNDGTPLTATTPTKNRTLRDILGYFYGSATQNQKDAINTFLQRNNLQTLP